MGARSSIEWTESTWNPVTGCTKLSPASPGCANCYAETVAERFRGTPGHYFEQGFDIQLRPRKLDDPLRWTRPRRVFVNSMSDLFHDEVPDEYIARVFAVMALAPRHTFQLLTKRHGRMRSLLTSRDVTGFGHTFEDMVRNIAANHRNNERRADWPDPAAVKWPLQNVWLGVSTENQQWADIRIPALLGTPAAVRFISAEPLLGPIDLAPTGAPPFWCLGHGMPTVDCPNDLHLPRHGLDWVIVGGESGHGARPMHPHWARSLRDQCRSAGVPFLFKQWGEWSPLAPLDKAGRYDFTSHRTMAVDGTLYEPGDLAYPDGPRVGEAHRADHGRVGRLTAMYRVGKKNSGRELDEMTHDEYPTR